jgi:cytochrome c oxidase assembly protein subunit 15
MGIATLWALSMVRPALRHALPKATKRMLHSAFFMANVQVALGVSTLVYLVPVPLAACHQAGAVALLTTMLHLLLTLRNPAQAARVWRQAAQAAATARNAAARQAQGASALPRMGKGAITPGPVSAQA